MFRLQVLASRGRQRAPANGSDLSPEQKAANSNPAGGSDEMPAQSPFLKAAPRGSRPYSPQSSGISRLSWAPLVAFFANHGVIKPAGSSALWVAVLAAWVTSLI
jgi:hypothetical protein